MEWIPRKYQVKAVEKLVLNYSAGLILDPGLGKTSITLKSIQMLKEGGMIKKALIVAPIRVMYDVWPREIKKWNQFNDLKLEFIHGEHKHHTLFHPKKETDIFLINPEGLLWLYKNNLEYRLKRCDIDCLVVDESTKFKNGSSIRTRYLASLSKYFKRSYILTGGMTPRSIEDIYYQVYLLDRGKSLCKSYGRFVREYFDEGLYSYETTEELENKIHERIMKSVEHLLLVLKAEDYIDMPELIVQDIKVTLPEAAFVNCHEVEEEFLTLMEAGVVDAYNVRAAGNKARQLANGAVYSRGEPIRNGDAIIGYKNKEIYHSHDSKIEALLELYESLGGQPLLVCYEFYHDYLRIKEAIPGAKYVGSRISDKKNSQEIDDFMKGKTRILVGHPQSMGHGLNLQDNCNHICFFGLSWNFEYYDQAMRRIHRSGQTKKSVFVYRIIASHTLEVVVADVLKRKERQQNKLVDYLKIRNNKK